LLNKERTIVSEGGSLTDDHNQRVYEGSLMMMATRRRKVRCHRELGKREKDESLGYLISSATKKVGTTMKHEQ
jgi:hypothetical protein